MQWQTNKKPNKENSINFMQGPHLNNHINISMIQLFTIHNTNNRIYNKPKFTIIFNHLLKIQDLKVHQHSLR